MCPTQRSACWRLGYRQALLIAHVLNIGVLSTGLGGELRSVPHAEKRVLEAMKLGYKQAIVPAVCAIKPSERLKDIRILACRTINDALTMMFGEGYDKEASPQADTEPDEDFEEGGFYA